MNIGKFLAVTYMIFVLSGFLYLLYNFIFAKINLTNALWISLIFIVNIIISVTQDN